MKKLRISSLLLAVLMVVAVMVPAMSLITFAGEEEDAFPAMPETLPGFDIRKWDYYVARDGVVSNSVGIPYSHRNAKFTTQLLVDYTQLADDQVKSNGAAATCGPEGLQAQKDTTVSLTDGLPEEYGYVWRGASGLLIAVDTTGSEKKNPEGDAPAGCGWHLEMSASVTRASLNGQQPVVNDILFASSPDYRTDWTSYYYTYSPNYVEYVCGDPNGLLGKNKDYIDAGEWACELIPNNNARIPDNFQGYIYLPFDYSFFCTGANGEGTYEGPGEYDRGGKKNRGDLLTFNEAVEVYEDVKINNISIYTASWDGTDWGAVFKSISVVFAEPAYNGAEDSSVVAVDGDVTITAPDTVANLTQDFSMVGADAIRFQIDTTGVNAPVALRLNMISNIKKNESRWAEGVILGNFVAGTDEPILDEETGLPTNVHYGYTTDVQTGEVTSITYPYNIKDENKTPLYGNNTYVTLTSDEYIKTISRGYDALIYYFDNGTPVPLTATDKTDIFAALPQGYKGEIYIPAASFSASITELLQISIINAGVMNYTGIDFSYESEGTGNVVISDIEIVQTEAAIGGTNFTVGNELALNVFAVVDDRYEIFAMEFYKNSKLADGAAVGQLIDADTNLYMFTLAGIGFDEMNADIDATLMLNGEKTAIQIADYSFAKYVANIADPTDTDNALAITAFVDLLYYGDTVNAYIAAQEETTAPELMVNQLSEAQRALRTADGAASFEGASNIEGDENEAYVWHEGEIAFENGQLSFDLMTFVEDEIGQSVFVAVIGEDDEATIYEINCQYWGIKGGLWQVRFVDLGVLDMNLEISAFVGWEESPDDEVLGQVYTTTVATTLAAMVKSPFTSAETKACANALYNVSVSMAALVASLEA